ncbi:hypothetical protein DL93DRAFT_1682377 [Clavulina sp. PMI_390]|nr:hypothetical protein DL93DRAFT_1682377 [Clavulina sp. PMI_390]
MLSRSPVPVRFRKYPPVSSVVSSSSPELDELDSAVESQSGAAPLGACRKRSRWTKADEIALRNVFRQDRAYQYESKEDFFESLAKQPQFRGRSGEAIAAKAKRMKWFTEIKQLRRKDWGFRSTANNDGKTERMEPAIPPRASDQDKRAQDSSTPAVPAMETNVVVNIRADAKRRPFTEYEDDNLERIWEENSFGSTTIPPLSFWASQYPQVSVLNQSRANSDCMGSLVPWKNCPRAQKARS